MEYLPFGETLVDEHINSYNSPYKFNAKELDEETGNYYYGARYYNPKWSVWLSVDAELEDYPGWSPYNYTLQNPVKFVDPDGNGVWKPDSKGNLIAEKGDTVETLAKYLNQTPEKVGSNYNYNGKNIGTNFEFSEGDKVIVDNNMTRSIKKGVGIGYNCHGSTSAIVQNKEVTPETAGYKGGLFSPLKSDDKYENSFSKIESFDEAVFGKTVIDFGDHSAVYYGSDNEGTPYFYSKNGNHKPTILTLDELKADYPSNDNPRLLNYEPTEPVD